MAFPAEVGADTPGELPQTPKSVSMESVTSVRCSFTEATTAPDTDSSPLSQDEPWKLPSFALAAPASCHGKPMMAILSESIAEELSVSQGPLPSPGSALHRSGGCRPCAWFHKAHGCANGDACRHCHLCSEDEIKARRKLKASTMRVEKSEKAVEERRAAISAEPLKVVPSTPVTGSGASELPPPPGLPAPRSPKPAAPEATLPSLGSALHGSGECKPCAWLYKGQGCQNGRDCRHCHLCPDGEIRHRRKAKVATLRQQGESEDSSPSSGALGKHALQWQQVQQAAMLTAQWEAQAAMWQASAPWDAVAQAALSAVSPHMAMPSPGSSLHHLGECRPCAWFWAPQGCPRGRACSDCHLCPQGAHAERRRAKERLSMMLPAAAARPFAPLTRTASGRSPHVVQIAPILGA